MCVVRFDQCRSCWGTYGVGQTINYHSFVRNVALKLAKVLFRGLVRHVISLTQDVDVRPMKYIFFIYISK